MTGAGSADPQGEHLIGFVLERKTLHGTRGREGEKLDKEPTGRHIVGSDHPRATVPEHELESNEVVQRKIQEQWRPARLD